MSDDLVYPPARDPGPGPRGLYDAPRLAARLGVSTSALRVARARQASWLPEPVGTLNGGLVWTAESLEGIEKAHPRRRRRTPEE